MTEPERGGPGPKLQAASPSGPGQLTPHLLREGPRDPESGRGAVSGWPPCRVRRPGPDPRPAGWSHPLARKFPTPAPASLPGAGPAATSQAPKFKEVRETLAETSAGVNEIRPPSGRLPPPAPPRPEVTPGGSRCGPHA